MTVGIKAESGTWRLWDGARWTDIKQAVHADVWNRLQLVLDETGHCQFAVQPVGQVARLIGRVRVSQEQDDSPIIPTIEPSPTAGHISCYDNVVITSGKPRRPGL
jgi:hypothetical protein